MTTDWIWNIPQKKAGIFTAGAPFNIQDYPPGMLEKLERYEEETFDTWLISDSGYSKIMVRDGIIISILCGKSLIYEDTDLFSLHPDIVMLILNQGTWYNESDEIFRNDDYPVKIVLVQEEIRWIIIW